MNQLFVWNFDVLLQVTFDPNQQNEQRNFYKKSILYFTGRFVPDVKNPSKLQLAQSWELPTKTSQNLQLYHESQPISEVLQKKMKTSELFKLYTSNSSVRVESIVQFFCYFWQFLWTNSQLKAFSDISTAGKHRGLSTIYTELNLFHRSKLGRNVELQDTHIVFFKTHRHVTQVITSSAKLDFGPDLIDWYRDATCNICFLRLNVVCHEQTIGYLI